MTIETLKSPNPRNRNSISVIKSKFLSVSSMNPLLAILKVTDARRDVILAGGLYQRFPWRHLPPPWKRLRLCNEDWVDFDGAVCGAIFFDWTIDFGWERKELESDALCWSKIESLRTSCFEWKYEMILAWNSSDCFESFSPLNNVWIDRPLMQSSDVTHYPKTG